MNFSIDITCAQEQLGHMIISKNKVFLFNKDIFDKFSRIFFNNGHSIDIVISNDLLKLYFSYIFILLKLISPKENFFLEDKRKKNID